MDKQVGRWTARVAIIKNNRLQTYVYTMYHKLTLTPISASVTTQLVGGEIYLKYQYNDLYVLIYKVGGALEQCKPFSSYLFIP